MNETIDKPKFLIDPKVLNYRCSVKTWRHASEFIEIFEYRDMSLSFYIRWKWYLEYRHALMRVKYPKAFHQVTMWQSKPSEFTEAQLFNKWVKDRITTCKRMVTKCYNGLARYEQEQKEKLIPDYEDESYLAVKQKMEEYENELAALLRHDFSLTDLSRAPGKANGYVRDMLEDDSVVKAAKEQVKKLNDGETD